MIDYPRDLLITEDVVREFEEKVGVRFINKTDCSNALAEHDAMVRADGYSQAENDYHKQTEKDRQSAFSCGYEKGRADAIDEFRDECESASYIPIGYGYYVTDMRSIRKIAEYLKEKKHDNT